jgi:anaerobic magnesium-protoporphyrin IX monomethyl ester cyclase
MKVELIHPPHANSVDDRLDPPLGLLLIAAHLRREIPGIEVRVNDMSGPARPAIGHADVYGITSYCTSLSFTERLARSIRRQEPKAKIVVGGANPTAMPEAYAFADHVIVGAGERAMLSIIRGEVTDRIVRAAPVDQELMALFPAYDLVDLSSYHRTIDGAPSVPMLSARGCPYRCAFCGQGTMHRLYGTAKADPRQVFDHIRRVVDECGVRAINFQDDVFTLVRRRLYELLDLIGTLGIVFRCHGRAGADNEEVYERLAEAGCRQVAWGIESGSQRMLDLMRKRAKVRDNRNVIRWAKKYGIISRAFFVIGFPGETAETMEETRRFIAEADPDQYFVSNFVPYPGTPVWENPERYGISRMSLDLDQYYQVGADGTGGLTIDTKWLSRAEFRELELSFRGWLRENKPRRGPLLDYERDLEAGQEERIDLAEFYGGLSEWMT